MCRCVAEHTLVSNYPGVLYNSEGAFFKIYLFIYCYYYYCYYFAVTLTLAYICAGNPEGRLRESSGSGANTGSCVVRRKVFAAALLPVVPQQLQPKVLAQPNTLRC